MAAGKGRVLVKRWLPATRAALGIDRPGMESKGLAQRIRSNSVAYTTTGTPYHQDWDTNRAVREGFQANPWIFRACEVIAYTGLRRKIVLRAGDYETGDKIPMRDDPSGVLRVLNRRANPWESAKMLRYRLYVLWLLSSKGLYLEITRSRAGRIAMITMLDPDLVDLIPSANNPISAFEVRTTGDTGGRRDPLPPFDPNDPDQVNSVLWLRSPHPTVLTQGMSPMQAAGLSVDLDRYARLFNRDYMQSNGRPGGILGIRGTVDPDTVIKLQDRFNGQARPGQVSAIQADAMFYQDLSSTPRDMQWGEVMDRMKKEASMVFGVPESMMGDASGRTFDNADAEYAIFLEHRFAPLVGMIDDQLDMLAGDDPELYLAHDLDDVWVLKRHRRAEEDRMAADLDRGAITYNDYREFRGLEPIDAPWAKVHWVTPGKLAGYAVDPADAAAAASAPMGGQSQPVDPGAAAQAGAAQGAELAGYNAQTNANAANLRLVAGEGQGRSPGGGSGALALTHARTAALEAAPTPELEGKESRARADRRPGVEPPVWR
jgi:HK97 family phage portal protein